jgi:hypothetical protein
MEPVSKYDREPEPTIDSEPDPNPDPEPITEDWKAETDATEDTLPSGSGIVVSAPSWETLLSAMEPRVAVGIFNLLNDPLQAVGELAGDSLSLHIANGFAFDMLNKQDILAQFRECASALAGRPITVSVSGMDTHEKLAERSIEELKRFKQVKFI